MLDQEVDPLVLQRVAVAGEPRQPRVRAAARPARIRRSHNRTAHARQTAATLQDAQVTWVRTIVPGPDPKCGYLVQPDSPVRMPLDGPLLPPDWTTEINYLANSDGSMTLSLTDGARRRFRCTRDSIGSSCDCPARATPSSCAPTPPRCRCASPPGRSEIWRRCDAMAGPRAVFADELLEIGVDSNRFASRGRVGRVTHARPRLTRVRRNAGKMRRVDVQTRTLAGATGHTLAGTWSRLGESNP